MISEPLSIPGAACAAHIKAGGDNLWFPEVGRGHNASHIHWQAHEICKTCPGSHACSAEADRNGERHGTWGGITRETGGSSAMRRRYTALRDRQRAAMETVWREQGVTITAPVRRNVGSTQAAELAKVIAMPTARRTLPAAERGPQPQHGNRSCWRRGCRCDECTRWHDTQEAQRRDAAAEALG